MKIFDVNQGSIVAQRQPADTIYTAALDRTNGLLWIGDGEERTGTVSALDVFEDEPTPIPEPTTAEPTETEPPETDTPTPTRGATTESPREAETPATQTDGQSGSGIAVAIAALLAAALLARRQGL